MVVCVTFPFIDEAVAVIPFVDDPVVKSVPGAAIDPDPPEPALSGLLKPYVCVWPGSVMVIVGAIFGKFACVIVRAAKAVVNAADPPVLAAPETMRNALLSCVVFFVQPVGAAVCWNVDIVPLGAPAAHWAPDDCALAARKTNPSEPTVSAVQMLPLPTIVFPLAVESPASVVRSESSGCLFGSAALIVSMSPCNSARAACASVEPRFPVGVTATAEAAAPEAVAGAPVVGTVIGDM